MKHSVRVFLKTFVLTVFTVLFVGLFFYTPAPRQIKKIKLFYESYATAPALWESIELIKSFSNNDEFKLFFFHRFPNRRKLFNLNKLNAMELDLNTKEGYFPYTASTFINAALEIAQKYPKAEVEVYSNINQTYFFLYPIMNVLGKRITHVHLYEDGEGNVCDNEYNAWSSLDFWKNFTLKHIGPKYYDFALYSDQAYVWKVTISKLVPTTYHLAQADHILNDKNMQNYVNFIGAENIKNIDLKHEANRLTPYEKKMLTRFFEINTNQLKRKNNKKTLLLTAGYFFDKEAALQREIDTFKTLKNAPYTIILKCHPSGSAQKECAKLKAAFPHWQNVQSNIPVEAFFLTDHEPDYVGGFSSSVYFVIPPEKILYVWGDVYVNKLFKLGIITPQQHEIPH